MSKKTEKQLVKEAADRLFITMTWLESWIENNITKQGLSLNEYEIHLLKTLVFDIVIKMLHKADTLPTMSRIIVKDFIFDFQKDITNTTQYEDDTED